MYTGLYAFYNYYIYNTCNFMYTLKTLVYMYLKHKLVYVVLIYMIEIFVCLKREQH